MNSQISLFQDSEKYNSLRRERYSARSFLQSFTSLKSTRTCGHHSFSGSVDFYRGVNSDGLYRSSIKNLISCQSLWACPYCSFSSSAVRSAQISNMLKSWSDLDYSVSFATLTVSHSKKTSLSFLWDNLLLAYKSFQSGKGYLTLKTNFNLIGSIRAVEATYGRNGWHLHIHLVFLHNAPIDLKKFSSSVYSRWESSTKLFNLTTSKSGFDIRRSYSDSGLSSYLSKNTYDLGSELTSTNIKKYANSRTPFTILYNMKLNNLNSCVCTNEDGSKKYLNLCDFCLWRDWEKTSKGRRQIGYSGKKSILNLLSQLDLDIDDVQENLIIFDNKYLFSMLNSEYKILLKADLVPTLLDLLQNSCLNEANMLLSDYGFYSYVLEEI